MVLFKRFEKVVKNQIIFNKRSDLCLWAPDLCLWIWIIWCSKYVSCPNNSFYINITVNTYIYVKVNDNTNDVVLPAAFVTGGNARVCASAVHGSAWRRSQSLLRPRCCLCILIHLWWRRGVSFQWSTLLINICWRCLVTFQWYTCVMYYI